jgi:hypothetical protein
MRLQKHFLDHILRIGGVAQDAQSNGKHARPLLAHHAFPVGHRNLLTEGKENALLPSIVAIGVEMLPGFSF